MTAPPISVIIPAYNAARTIGPCLAALRDQAFDKPYEIIVVDDGSTDGTAEVARAAGATIISIPRGRPAAARNAGIRAAQGGIICCTDADCAPQPGWLRELTAPFGDPTIMAAKGAYETRQRQLVARFVQLEYEDKYDRLRQQPAIDFIDTYSAAYRRDVLLANGGFDVRFDYLEDQELSFRLAARGCRMVFRETAVVDHRHSATWRAYLRKKAIIGYWKAQVVRRHPDRAGGVGGARLRRHDPALRRQGVAQRPTGGGGSATFAFRPSGGAEPGVHLGRAPAAARHYRPTAGQG